MKRRDSISWHGRTIMFGVWGVAVLTSVVVLWAYEKQPCGNFGEARDRWPANDLIQSDPNRPTAIMFAHPKCPCTRASIRQFTNLVRGADASVLIVFYVPQDADATWRKTENTKLASAIPGVTVAWDVEGETARRFQADVSGQCFVFSPQKQCSFAGGITISRGHEGDNLGATSFAACLTSTPTTTHVYPCYGCALFPH